MHFPQNTDIKTSSNIFIFIQSRMIVKIIVKTLGNSLKIRVEYYPHLKINEKKRLLNKQEQIKEISIKETGRTGQFAKIETK